MDRFHYGFCYRKENLKTITHKQHVMLDTVPESVKESYSASNYSYHVNLLKKPRSFA